MKKLILIGLALSLLIMSGCSKEKVSTECLENIGNDICEAEGFKQIAGSITLATIYCREDWLTYCEPLGRIPDNYKERVCFTAEEVESCTFERGKKQ